MIDAYTLSLHVGLPPRCMCPRIVALVSIPVDLLLEGKTNRVVGYQHGEFVDYDINEALQMHKEIPEYAYRVSKDLAL